MRQVIPFDWLENRLFITSRPPLVGWVAGAFARVLELRPVPSCGMILPKLPSPLASDNALAAVHAIDDTKSAADPLDVFMRALDMIQIFVKLNRYCRWSHAWRRGV
jgi:hypothetical protein